MFRSLKEFRKTTWRIHPVLDVPDLQPPVVLFSVFEEDPLEKFRKIRESASDKERIPNHEVPKGAAPQLLRHGRLSAMWDSLFREIAGNRVSFLYQAPTPKRKSKSKHAKSRTAGAQVMTLLVSNGPPGTKWVVTRAVLYNGKTVCWCIPVTVATGKSRKVRLTGRNMIELEAD